MSDNVTVSEDHIFPAKARFSFPTHLELMAMFLVELTFIVHSSVVIHLPIPSPLPAFWTADLVLVADFVTLLSNGRFW